MYLSVCGRVTVVGCLRFIPISWMGPKHATKDTFNFSTNLYALEHVHVVQIWIMHINALITQIMHKNVQTNPEKSQKWTQHSCCSMLTRQILESNKRQWISFRPQRPPGRCISLFFLVSDRAGAFPTETIMLVVRSSSLWEAYTQPAPNGTKNLPRHVNAAPW